MSELASAGRWWQPADRIRSAAVTLAVAALIFLDVSGGSAHRAEVSVAAVTALVFIAVAVRFPGLALCVVLGYVPVQVLILAFLYHHGVPAPLVKDLGYMKDAMVAGIAIRALAEMAGHRHALRIDTLDWFTLMYVGIATAYLLLPLEFHGILGAQPTQVRLNAWRLDCLFAVLMFAARRIDFSPAWLKAAAGTVIVMGVVMLAFGILETVDAARYNHIFQATLGVPEYQYNILNTIPPANTNYVIKSVIGGVSVVRVGGTFADSIALGFYMVIPVGLCLERMMGRRMTMPMIFGLAGSITTLILTETRSAILGGGVAITLAVALAFRNKSPGRYRLAVLTVAAAVLVIPLSAGTALRGRVASGLNGSDNADSDTVTHEFRTFGAIKQVIVDPAGKGLGSNPATGGRFHTSIGEAVENSYLQVGIELGLAGMIAFLGMYMAMLSRLLAESRRRSAGSAIAGGMWLAGWGLFAGGMFLHVWTLFPVSLSFWGLAGASLSAPQGPAQRHVEHSHAHHSQAGHAHTGHALVG